MNNNVLPLAEQVALVDLVVDSTAYATAKLHLFKNDINPNSESLLADFIEADFDGYVAPTCTFGAAYIDPDGTPLSSAGEKMFVQDDAIGNDIYGAYLTDAAGTTLLRSARFADAPYPLVNAGDALPVNVKVGLDIGLIDVTPTP